MNQNTDRAGVGSLAPGRKRWLSAFGIAMVLLGIGALFLMLSPRRTEEHAQNQGSGPIDQADAVIDERKGEAVLTPGHTGPVPTVPRTGPIFKVRLANMD